METTGKLRHPGLWLGAVALTAAASALWLFPSAVPTLALGQRLTRQAALQRADSFFGVHALAPDGARTAVRFRADDPLRTFIDLAGGGPDTLDAMLRGGDVALYRWSVRAFLPRDPHEARVDFAPDGRVVGFRRDLAEADERPALSEPDGRRLAEEVATSWIGEDLTRWRLVTSSYETRKASGRVDRTYTFERTDRQVADAPIRLDVVIAGDLPSGARPYVVIPEAFERRYGEMRSANDLLALIAQAGMLGLLILGALVLRHYVLARGVRWLPALLVGGVIGALACAAGLNEFPGSWYGYDTATSPATFSAIVVMQAVTGGAGLALVVGLTLAAAEVAARHAFPRHLDWWRTWEHRGTRQVAGRVAAGYTAALVAFAYVALFYLVTRRVLGWWVPSELLDDPNLIATPMPWLSGIAASLHAGVWEESLFRALPLSLLAIWARQRRHRGWWMAAGVVATALVFGFAHANYPSWPPYSRGVEIFLDACVWAVLFLWLGLLVTVVAHFAYDLVLFGLFAASGSGVEYRITAVVILFALLGPALLVAWRWIRQRRLAELPEEARFGAWTPPAVVERPRSAPRVGPSALGPRSRMFAVVVGAAALLLTVLLPSAPPLGAPFTANRRRVVATADSMMRARGADPASWKRLITTAQDTLSGWARFLTEESAEELADTLAATYVPPAWWVVRYVHASGTADERAEEWRMRLRPDGSPLDAHHIVPDSARGDTLDVEDARRLARGAIASAGLDALALRESDVEATERPARRDFTVTYTDTTVALPGDAAARVKVTLAGAEPVLVRRSVELPDAFMRAQRERGTTRLVVALVLGTLFATLVVVGVVVVIRGRAPVLEDGLLSRRRSVALTGVLTLLGMAAMLDRLPAQLFGYDTAMPWSNWIGINIVLAALTVVPALVAVALLLVLAALRRRVGIPLLPDGDARARRRDVLAAGLGLGGTVALLRELVSLAGRAGIGAAPTTGLGQQLPWLGGVLSLPMQVVFTVAVVAIPALAVAGIASRPAPRALAVAALLAPMVALAIVLAPPGASPWLRGSVLLGGILLAGGLSVALWAACCGWAWVVAGVVAAGFVAVRTATHAPTGVEQVGGAVTLVGVMGLVWLAARVAWAGGAARPSGEERTLADVSG